jgi:hypothetical protein
MSSGAYHGLFLYTSISNVKKYNFVLYSTISDSYQVDTSKGSCGTIILYYGQIRIISTNSSNNNCYYYSSFYLEAISNNGYYDQLNYSTEDSYIHYCYVINCYAYYRDCIGFINYIHKCYESNIINNSQKDSDCGTIYNSGSATTTINKCCFFNNNDSNYGSGKYLFYVNSGTLSVTECYVQSGYQHTTYDVNGVYKEGSINTDFDNNDDDKDKDT